MSVWVEECQHCGYVAQDLSQPTRIQTAYLKTEAFQNCDGIRFPDPLAERFYRQYLILLRERQFERAFFSILHAAWVCDDARDKENAARCRCTAADLMEKFLLPHSLHNHLFELLYADVLRRSGQFEKLLDKFSGAWPENETARKYIAFECVLALKKDAGRYTVDDAERFHEELIEQSSTYAPESPVPADR